MHDARRAAVGWLEREKVAAAWHGLDDPVIFVAQGMAYVPDALDQGIVGDEDTRPDCLDELVLADHPARILGKIAQDVEGLGPQLDLLVSPPQRASLQVQRVNVETHDVWGDGRHVLNQRWPPDSPKFRRTFSTPSLRACLIRSTYQGPRQGATMQADWDEAHGSFDAVWNSRTKRRTSMPASSPSISDLWSALPDLAAEARARSLEFEEHRKLAPDFADKLKRVGLFKILVPADAGGLAGSLPQWLEIIMALAEADASTGWVTAHANLCAGLIYASAEPRFRDEFFADPCACAAWSNLPRVKVKEQDDGIRITGSWSFESGCTAATFVGGMVSLSPFAEGGPPRMVAALAPVSEAKIEETWDPVGLAGTGSHDVHFDDLFVPWHRTFPWPAGIPVSAYPAAIFVPGRGSSLSAPGRRTSALPVEHSTRRATNCAARPTVTPRSRCSSTRPRNATSKRQKDFGSLVAPACARRSRRCGKVPCAVSPRRQTCVSTLALPPSRRCTEARKSCAPPMMLQVRAQCVRAGVMQRLMREASCLTHHISANQASYELTGRVRCGIDKLSFRI